MAGRLVELARRLRIADYAHWLDDADLKELHGLLKPLAAESMAVSEASALVNSPKNEGSQLLDPAA